MSFLTLCCVFYWFCSFVHGDNDNEFVNWQHGFPKHHRHGEILKFRGGDAGCDPATQRCESSTKIDIDSLVSKFGPSIHIDFQINADEHKLDCATSCETFTCVTSNTPPPHINFTKYPFGSVPPEDFSNQFAYPLNLILVSKQPLFPPSVARSVIANSEIEGVSNGEYVSGKYKLGGEWLSNLPITLNFFNELLVQSIYPLLHAQFPEIVSSQSSIRPHSVSLLRYNSTHPRTDVHVDNGILALTLALSSKSDFTGGGTFFEHIENIVEMNEGEVTIRPGSIRHGGNKVSSGTRYVLGAFFLLEDKVEHVRRFKNRGAKARTKLDYNEAERFFGIALAINAKCVTCLKDLSELYLVQDRLDEALATLQRALDLVEQDSDALFSMGVIYSKLNRDSDSIVAYEKSVEINSDDFELWYNLAMKYEETNRTRAFEMYEQCLSCNPAYGPAYINLGTLQAEEGNFLAAEKNFERALTTELAVQASVNLAILYLQQGNHLAAQGELGGGLEKMVGGLEMINRAISEGGGDGNGNGNGNGSGSGNGNDAQIRTKLFVGKGQMEAALDMFGESEATFRELVKISPKTQIGYQGLSKVLSLQGKHAEADLVKQIFLDNN